MSGVKEYYAPRILNLESMISGLKRQIPASIGNRPRKLRKIENLAVLEECKWISTELQNLGLRFTKMAVDDFVKLNPYWNSSDVARSAENITERFHHELESLTFFFVSQDAARLYNQSAFFGERVADAFPSVEYDIRETANCLALDRHTAAVMHSMRVLEAGLTAVGARFGMKRGDRGWGPDLKIFKQRWGDIFSGTIAFKIVGGPRKWNQFFSEAFADFRHFAGAWRNHAVHDPNTIYTNEEAMHITDHVRSFMDHLSTRLRERRQKAIG